MATAAATRHVRGLDPGDFLIVQERERLMHRLLRRHEFGSLEEVRVFEAGCGEGYNLRMFQQWGCQPCNLAGIDIDTRRTARLRERSPGMRIHDGDAARIPEPNEAFDITLAFTMFSSIEDETTSAQAAREMVRITRPGGLILVYDMRRRSPRNGAVHPITDEDIARWFPECKPAVRRLTLAPPVARAVARPAPWLYGPMALLPPARTHSLYCMRRPMTSPTSVGDAAS